MNKHSWSGAQPRGQPYAQYGHSSSRFHGWQNTPWQNAAQSFWDQFGSPSSSGKGQDNRTHSETRVYHSEQQPDERDTEIIDANQGTDKRYDNDKDGPDTDDYF